MRSVFVIIREIFAPKPSEMAFVERDDVVQHRANTADLSMANCQIGINVVFLMS